MEAGLRRNIKLIYAIDFGWMFILPLAVIVPYFQSIGLSMQEVFEVQAVFSAAVLILELPSGYIADLLGRKKTILLATLFHALTFSFFPLARGYWDIVIIEIFMAIGVSLFSGSDVALIYDSMEALGKGKEQSKLVGEQIFFKQMGETLSALIGGWLAIMGLMTVVWANAVVLWAPFFLSFFLTEPPRKKMSAVGHKENLGYIYKSLFKQGPLLILILLNTVVYGLATLVAVWSFQPFWKQVGFELSHFGYLWALSNVTVALVARKAHLFEVNFGATRSLLFMGVLPIIAYFLMAYVSTQTGHWVWFLLAAIVGMIFQTCRGLGQVLLKNALNSRVEGDMRATANSVSSLGLRVLFIVFGPLMGYLIDNHGQAYSFTSYGILYVFCFVAVLLPLLAKRSQFKKAES